MPKNYVLKCDPANISILTKKVPLRCGRCGDSRNWNVIVTPEGRMARVVILECKCGNHWTVDERGYLGTTGEITVIHKELGDGRVQ